MLCGYGYADFYWVSRRLMSDSVIRVEGLSKKYVLGHQSEGRSQYKSLRDAVAEGARSMFRRKERSDRDEFWALRDVDFEIRQGDRVGIIGRNGAGKSTLLKVLSRIVEPTTGRIGIKGRVASLLEVGTGFHPELTGRENIYLNGAILGMSRREIDRKFDEIVAFAEVEKFLDTPVKRYSSGMYVRLAFAVAAHLEPEILIVDEVLAVGDAQFQKKCLGKMEDVAGEGRTVIFVSHQMSAIQALCDRAIVLQNGTVHRDASTRDGINAYLETAHTLSNQTKLADRKDRTGSGLIKAIDLQILDRDGIPTTSPESGGDYCLELTCQNSLGRQMSSVVVSLHICDERDSIVMLFRTNFNDSNLTMLPGISKVRCQIQRLPLVIGMYRVSAFISYADQETLDFINDAAAFRIDSGDFFGTGSPGLPNHCKILVDSNWHIENLGETSLCMGLAD
jgi:lipopolysaccharide transport system ATP-binding protein